MSVDLSRCLTRLELCDLLKITPSASRRMDRAGTGPRPIRISPRAVRYAPAEVAEFMSTAGLSPPAELSVGRDGIALPGSL